MGFNSGFSPLPGDHMVRTGVGGIGRYSTLARSWNQIGFGATSWAEGPVLCCTVLCSKTVHNIPSAASPMTYTTVT